MRARTSKAQHIAIIGAGIAGITCARTLVQAGHHVTVFEKSPGVGGRMASRRSAFGTFDHGAQYFTVRDPRFTQALNTTPQVCKPWSANAVRVLDEHGLVVAAALPARESHWVATPAMNALVKAWAQPLTDQVVLQTPIVGLEKDAIHANQWQIRANQQSADPSVRAVVFGGFDKVILALPQPQASALLKTAHSTLALQKRIAATSVLPCWTLMVAFPQASQPGLNTFGPQWNVARSTHHRIAWLARESSKPQRDNVERWTVQASSAWSLEHINDDKTRVEAKLMKAFSEVTGIRAQPSHVESHRWLYAKTDQALGESFVLDAQQGIGICGDWCLGHRVEDAFVSGLELALAVA